MNTNNMKTENNAQKQEEGENTEKNLKTPGYEEIVTMKPDEIKQEFARLENMIENLSSENQDFQEKFKRTQADFANYRRRVKQEKADLAVKYKCEIVEKLLPVLDNFERALETEKPDEEFIKGVEMIYRQLKDVLKKEGIEEIEAEGKEFNHRLHEAVEQVEGSEEEKGIVAEEVQSGYKLDDTVIRPALVKVVD